MMLNKIRQFFTPPVFADEDKTRIASHIYLLSKMGMTAAAIFAILIPLLTEEISNRTISMLVVIPVVLIELSLVKKGYVRLAAISLVTVAWVLGNYTTLDTGGVRAVGFGINLIVVLGAGMLINLQAALIFGLMSSLLGLGMAIMQTRGILPPIASGVNAFSAWITQSVFLMFMAGLLYLTVNYIQQALLRARRAEALLRGLIENTPDFVMEVDRTGMITFANRFPDQIVGTDVRRFVLNKHIPLINRTIATSFEIAEQASLEIQTRNLDDSVSWNSVRIGPIMHDGQVTSLTVFVSNIAERKQVEAEREKLVAELEKRNAELERYTYTLSHELKTPIVTIRGFLGFVEASIKAGNLERAKADFARIGNAADKMYLMINELLELSRIGRLINPPEDVPFEEVVLAGLSTSEPAVKERNIKIHIQPNLPNVRVDLTRLIEVINNLVENAVKYMGNQAEPQIEIGMREDISETEWTFFIKDNGMGIDPVYQDKLFGLFDKIDPQSEGTGIGLALVKRIIEMHNGRIWVESAGLGLGSEFCFTLPKE